MSSPPPTRTPARQFARATTHTDLTIAYEGYSEEIPTRVPDISPQGMFINTPRTFAEGTVLKVSFRLTGSGRVIYTRAEVRFCLAGVGVGVEFVEITQEDRDAIATELAIWDR